MRRSWPSIRSRGSRRRLRAVCCFLSLCSYIRPSLFSIPFIRVAIVIDSGLLQQSLHARLCRYQRRYDSAIAWIKAQ